MSVPDTRRAQIVPGARPARANDAWLRWDRVISRDFVHRRALAEVWVADTAQVGVDEFLVATQLPRAHTLWSDRGTVYHDPLFTIEIGRQACLALSHLYYRVPLDWQFISRTINLRVLELAAYVDDQASPPEAVLRVRFTGKWERDELLRGMSMEGELVIGGLQAASIHGDLAFFPREEYEQLRRHVRERKPLAGARRRIVPHPLDPRRVGRLLEANVAIESGRAPQATAGESRFVAVIDERNPCHFDHPQDHVPGAMLMEIYRQSAIATATDGDIDAAPGAVFTGCAVELSEFAELDAPVECSAVVIERSGDGRAQIALQLHQFDTQIGAARVELTFVPARDRR
jgi:hypothetical protein